MESEACIEEEDELLSIEEWTNAISLFNSVLRQGNLNNYGLFESHSVCIQIIRSIQKDEGRIGSIMRKHFEKPDKGILHCLGDMLIGCYIVVL